MKRRWLSIRTFVIAFGLLSFLVFIVLVVGFFDNLNSATTLYSWGDTSYFNQSFYNFVNNRPFQTSIYRIWGRGILDNPYAYANSATVHVNYTPYLFTLPYRFWQDINALYAIVLLINYAGAACFSWLILKHLSPKTSSTKALMALSLFASSSALLIIQFQAAFLLFAGPFILAAYYFLITGRRWAFLAAAVLLTLVSEDAAMFVISLSIYIFFFETRFRSYAYISGIMGVSWTILSLFVIQPAARYELVVTESAHSLNELASLSARFPNLLYELWATKDWTLPIISFLPAFAIVHLLFSRGTRIDRSEWAKTLGLIFVAPLSHWAILVLVPTPGGHRTLPVMLSLLLALLRLLGAMKDNGDHTLTLRRGLLSGLVMVVFLSANLFVMRGNVPTSIRYWAKAVSGGREAAQEVEERREQERANKVVIEAVKTMIPSTRSLTYWTNMGVDAFLSNRSDLWRYPYYLDKADFLLIQKGASHSWFPEYDSPIPLEKVNEIIGDLTVNQRTHRVVSNTNDLVMLERNEKYTFVMPPSSVGFGWVNNVPKLFRIGGS